MPGNPSSSSSDPNQAPPHTTFTTASEINVEDVPSALRSAPDSTDPAMIEAHFRQLLENKISAQGVPYTEKEAPPGGLLYSLIHDPKALTTFSGQIASANQHYHDMKNLQKWKEECFAMAKRFQDAENSLNSRLAGNFKDNDWHRSVQAMSNWAAGTKNGVLPGDTEPTSGFEPGVLSDTQKKRLLKQVPIGRLTNFAVEDGRTEDLPMIKAYLDWLTDKESQEAYSRSLEQTMAIGNKYFGSKDEEYSGTGKSSERLRARPGIAEMTPEELEDASTITQALFYSTSPGYLQKDDAARTFASLAITDPELAMILLKKSRMVSAVNTHGLYYLAKKLGEVAGPFKAGTLEMEKRPDDWKDFSGHAKSVASTTGFAREGRGVLSNLSTHTVSKDTIAELHTAMTEPELSPAQKAFVKSIESLKTGNAPSAVHEMMTRVLLAAKQNQAKGRESANDTEPESDASGSEVE